MNGIRLLIVMWALAATPAVAGSGDLDARYQDAVPFSEFLAGVYQHQGLWEGNRRRAEVPTDVADAMQRLGGRWRLLAITESACLDSANTLPYVAELAERFDNLELRVLERSMGEDLLAQRPVYRGTGAVPTVLILDEAGNEAGCWVEQPGAQRAFQIDVLDRQSGRKREQSRERYLDWYRQDAGASTLRELVLLLDAASRGARGCSLLRGGSP